VAVQSMEFCLLWKTYRQRASHV